MEEIKSDQLSEKEFSDINMLKYNGNFPLLREMLDKGYVVVNFGEGSWDGEKRVTSALIFTRPDREKFYVYQTSEEINKASLSFNGYGRKTLPNSLSFTLSREELNKYLESNKIKLLPGRDLASLVNGYPLSFPTDISGRNTTHRNL